MTKQLVLLCTIALLFCTVGTAAVCTTGTVASYISLGTTGCTYGDKTFSNFTFTSSASGGGVAPTAAGIAVTPVTVLGDLGLQFNALWTANSNQIVDTTINFDVFVQGGAGMLIEDASTVQSSGGFTGTGTASVTEGICGPTPCLTTVSTTTINTAGTTQLSDHVTFTPTGSIHAVKDIGVSGGTSGTASLSQVIDTFSQTAVPEPASVMLFGTLLLGVGQICRRRMAK